MVEAQAEARSRRPPLFDFESPEYEQAKQEAKDFAIFVDSKKGSSDLTDWHLVRFNNELESIKGLLDDPRSMSLKDIRKRIRETRADLNRLEQQQHLEKLQAAQNPFSPENKARRDQERRNIETGLELLESILRSKKPKDLSPYKVAHWDRIQTQAKGLRQQLSGGGLEANALEEIREVAERFGAIQEFPAHYLDRFLDIRRRLESRAKDLGEKVDEELFKKLKPALMQLAAQELPAAQVDEALDELLVEAF